MFIVFFPTLRVSTWISHDILIFGYSWWSVSSFDPITSPSGHSRSYEVNFVFFFIKLLTEYRIDTEHWKCPNVFPSHGRIDWYATWPTWLNTWPWADVKFRHWPFKVNMYLYRSTRLDERSTMLPILPPAFLIQVIREKIAKIAILTFLDLCSLTRWSWPMPTR